MNQPGVNQIFFEESRIVPLDHTARSPGSQVSGDTGCVGSTIQCVATADLVAMIESLCVREMQAHIDGVIQIAASRTIRIEHRGPVPAGSLLRLRGWVELLGGRSVTFRVQGFDDHELVCEALVTLVVMRRASMESRIAAKVAAPDFARTLPYRPSKAQACDIPC
jgi:fluoroacetyl-CoA thioesterase